MNFILFVLLIGITLRLIRLDYDYRKLKGEFKLKNKELEIVQNIVFGLIEKNNEKY